MIQTLTDAQLQQLRRELVRQRLSLDTELARMANSLAEVREARSGADADDEHDPDGATMSSEWSRIAGISSELGARSDALDRALARFSTGSYGVCIRCGGPVGFARLDALPAAELCIECARLA